MSSININSPEGQFGVAPDQYPWLRAACAMAAFVQLPGLPCFHGWSIAWIYGPEMTSTDRFVQVSAQLHGYVDGDVREVLAGLAGRFSGVASEDGMPFPSGRVHTQVAFEFVGVQFSLWTHVAPLVDAPVEVAS